jgi:predicted nuclease of predicted toxin-antitoxin system
LKIKVDENIGRSGVDQLRQAGHDVATVPEEGLSGSADDMVLRACVAEQRTLITLDRDFGQVPRFPPRETAGIAILELGGPATLPLLRSRLREFLVLAATRPIEGELWIVEPGRVRVHLDKDAE